MDPNNRVIKRLWCSLWQEKNNNISYMGSAKQNCLEYAQNVRIHIILHMPNVSSGHLLSIETFCSIQWFCLWTVKAWIRLHRCAVWSGLHCPHIPALARRHIYARRGPYVNNIESVLIAHQGFGYNKFKKKQNKTKTDNSLNFKQEKHEHFFEGRNKRDN